METRCVFCSDLDLQWVKNAPKGTKPIQGDWYKALCKLDSTLDVTSCVVALEANSLCPKIQKQIKKEIGKMERLELDRSDFTETAWDYIISTLGINDYNEKEKQFYSFDVVVDCEKTLKNYKEAKEG